MYNKQKYNTHNILFFMKNLFFLLLIVAGLSLSVDSKAENKQVTDSVLIKLLQYPETISSYSIGELTKDMDKTRIKQMSKVICSLSGNGISRSIIRQHYFPLCRSVIESYFHESELLQEIALHRDFTSEHMIQADNINTGRNIITRFIEYQRVCMAIQELPLENRAFNPVFYGDMRMMEGVIWGDNKYMDKLDPIPERLIANLSNLFGVKISTLEKDLYRLLQTYSQDFDFLTNNAALLLDASTYLSKYQMGMVIGTVSASYISQDRKQELLDLINSIFSKRWGAKLWDKLKPIIIYRITGMVEVERVKTFLYYKDSLLSQHIEFAKYYPHKCPDDMKQSVAFEEYNNKFYDALDYIFVAFIKETSDGQCSLGPQFFNSIGCSSQAEFFRLYTEETLKRYYDKDDFRMWGKIENICRYLENTSKYPVDIALHIVDCYSPINALKARDFIRQTSLDTWIDEQMMNSQQDVNELGLRAASVIAYVYASLYNEARYPDVLKYVEWTDKNIEGIGSNKDGIIFNIASALSLMEKHEDSNTWISKVRIDKSEYRQEFYRLLLENNCKLGHTKEAIKVASKMDSFSYQDILLLLSAKLRENREECLEELLSVFTISLSHDFNLFSLMDSEDQDWSSHVAKYRVTDLLRDMDISSWVKEEMNEKQVQSLVEPYIAAMRYNWALASKGALLRSNKFMRELILNKMPSEQYQYFRHALDYEEEDYQEDNLNHRLDAFVSEQAKVILLDYVRKDTTYVLPQFDYNVVREQLHTGDIAIELVRLDKDLFDVVMIRKDWEFPKYVGLLRSNKEDNCQRLWSHLTPYLTGIQKIYISLDGEYNFENIELTTDSAGVCMGDRYNIYRVSTTLSIPKDIYLSDIQYAVLYGNLKYADSDENLETRIAAKQDDKRGAVSDCWMPLDGTEKELNAIFKILTDTNIPYKPYQGENGNKTSFVALNQQEVNLLHMATHGFYNDEDVSDADGVSAMKRSGIVLSNSAYDLWYSKQSGTIFANEIANMDLNSVKLLVLSACETAKGNLGNDGVFGLQRGFKQAGAGCIIMSLKKVNDVMTTELMQLFYSSLTKGQSVRKSFRNAQKQIASKYKIDDWKSFIIID